MLRRALSFLLAALSAAAQTQTLPKCKPPSSRAPAACPAPPTAAGGWTQQLPLLFDINWPYDTLDKCTAPPADGTECTRYSVDANGVFTFWVYGSDKPFQKGSKTSPRSEHRFRPNYTSGQLHYSADFQVAAASDHVCILQIHTGAPQDKDPKYGETTFMLFWSLKNGGSVSCYNDLPLASGLGTDWFHVDLTHDVTTGVVTVCINGQAPHAIQDNGAKNFFLKDGVYAQTGHSTKMQASIKNIQIWTHAL
ncbi:MAG: hypothetical protein QOI58_2603 [Thermoanaerobaculia bacterium]|jgi:hypothetical protein|nr:hypothetical protein [Thermoanaerobaculia bacterium]